MSKLNANSEVNPWNLIPLNDYETHMSDSSVGQMKLLSDLTKKYLDEIKPKCCIFLGIAGGNGLEHIDTEFTKNVIGIDINQDYLDETCRRYEAKITHLKLILYDLTVETREICKADLVWAALILEYTGIDKCLQFSDKNLLPGGHFVVSIQVNNGIKSVSSTGIESIRKAGDIFEIVNDEILLIKTTAAGLLLKSKEENNLPNGKSIKTFHFVKDD